MKEFKITENIAKLWPWYFEPTQNYILRVFGGIWMRLRYKTYWPQEQAAGTLKGHNFKDEFKE